MKSVIVVGSLLAAMWLGLPLAAAAQEPEPAPLPAPEPPPPPPPPARETAVPRAERIRESGERGASRDAGPITRESAREGDPEQRRSGGARPEPATRDRAAGEQRGSDEGARRRIPATAAVEPSVASSPSPASADQAVERRGAVRRPPSDRGSAPRDRAVARTSPPIDRDRDRQTVYVYPDYWSYNRYSYDPYYYGGFHVGYLAYSPWGWTPAFYGYPAGYGYSYGYGPVYQARGWDLGAVKLKVRPRDAEVYVDGYFAGHVDDFDGAFQSLRLDSGAYRIEIRKAGYEPLYFDVRVQPDRTITYRGELKTVP